MFFEKIDGCLFFPLCQPLAQGLQLFNSQPLSVFSGRNQNNKNQHQSIPAIQGSFGNAFCLPLFSCCAVLCLVAQSCPTLCYPMDCSPPGSSVQGDSPGKNTGMGCYTLLQGIFPTQGLDPGLLHCRRILYCLSHQGSPRILYWVAYPFSSRSA